MPAPLLLLPGLLSDATIWAAQVAAFRDLDPRVADYGDADSLALMAERALTGAPDRVSLAGHSMGARVALEVMRIAPERIERLALLDTGIHTVSPGEPEKRRRLIDLARAEGMERMVAEWLPPMVHPRLRHNGVFMAPLKRMAVSAGRARFEAQIAALLGRPEVESLLASIACPTLVGVGRQDEWSPVAQHEEMAALIPGAVLAVFEESGHMAPVEAPDQVNRALRRWLAR